MIDQDKLISGIRSLKFFINKSLALSPKNNEVSGFELVPWLIEASTCNTYIETVCNKADTLYSRIKDSLTEMTTHSYLDQIKWFSNKFDWKNKEFVLAFDYTDEEFYGEVQGLDIHGWKKSSAISGKFKFLTCSVISDDIPEKIPLLSVPIQIGHYKSQVISYMLSKIKPYIGSIELIVFDRGFYDKDLMYELIQSNYPFLIFVPKSKDKKEILYPLEEGDKFTLFWENEVNKDKSNMKFEYFLTFMKQIYSKRADTYFDWVFATNIDTIKLDEMVKTYRKRWRIETGFRVQDEARIKCKSKEMKIRYFLFMFQQMLQTQWVCSHKEEVPFKKYLIELSDVAKEYAKKPKANYGKS